MPLTCSSEPVLHPFSLPRLAALEFLDSAKALSHGIVLATTSAENILSYGCCFSISSLSLKVNSQGFPDHSLMWLPDSTKHRLYLLSSQYTIFSRNLLKTYFEILQICTEVEPWVFLLSFKWLSPFYCKVQWVKITCFSLQSKGLTQCLVHDKLNFCFDGEEKSRTALKRMVPPRKWNRMGGVLRTTGNLFISLFPARLWVKD